MPASANWPNVINKIHLLQLKTSYSVELKQISEISGYTFIRIQFQAALKYILHVKVTNSVLS